MNKTRENLTSNYLKTKVLECVNWTMDNFDGCILTPFENSRITNIGNRDGSNTTYYNQRFVTNVSGSTGCWLTDNKVFMMHLTIVITYDDGKWGIKGDITFTPTTGSDKPHSINIEKILHCEDSEINTMVFVKDVLNEY